MSITPDRPHYSTGTPISDTIDQSTREASRGTDPATGIKGAEPAEPVPTITSRNPATNLPLVGGTVVVVTGDNMGGSTGATIGGTAVTAFSVLSETQVQFTTPAKAGGTHALVIQNPAGNSAGFNVTYA
jgi:hypothetical protein